MAALHRLLGAPGEPNRGVVQHFLMSKGWITGEQAPEDWPLFCVPQNKEQMAKLHDEVARFEQQMRQQELTEEQA